MFPDKSKFQEVLKQAQQKTGARLAGKVTGLERVLEISRQIATLDLEQALALIVQHLLALSGADRGMVMFCDGKQEPRFEYGIGLSAEEVADGQFEISRSVTDQAIREQRLIVIEDVPASGFRNQASVVRLGLSALIVIPLIGRERLIGVIYADTDKPDHRISPDDTSVLAAFGSQAAIAIENARLHEKVKEEYLFLKEPPTGAHRFDMMVYQSRAMHRVHQTIQQVLNNDITVLVRGESGTGKELVAHALHFQGQRKHRPFVTQNTGSLTDTLLESELFGHTRGAFSGAITDKAGLFEIADGGTVFLDEIGEASPALQVRLLRFLETQKFRRVGDTRERSANVRIIAATHRDLREAVALGGFREDLFYRLNVFPIDLPPLRERREDIPLLVNHFMAEFNQKMGKPVRSISKRVMALLVEREWKGNIRELRNYVYRMMVLAPGDELVWPESPNEPIVQELETPPAPHDFKTLEEMERDYIKFVLKKMDGNQSRAAAGLGMKRTTFISRLKKLGIT